MKALSIVSGILAVLMLIATIGTSDWTGLVSVVIFAALCWFAMKKAKDPARQEKIQAKKAEKMAAKATKNERKQKPTKTPEEIENERRYRELTKQYAQERRDANRTPVAAVLITTNSHTSGVGAAGRAVVGGALLGPVGALAGAVSGTSKATKATFSVKYANGRTAVETVDINSRRFKELSALLMK